MKSISSGLQDKLDNGGGLLATCCIITPKVLPPFGLTSYERGITIDGILCSPAGIVPSDTELDEQAVSLQGRLLLPIDRIGLTQAQILGGVLDEATASVFVVDATAPPSTLSGEPPDYLMKYQGVVGKVSVLADRTYGIEIVDRLTVLGGMSTFRTSRLCRATYGDPSTGCYRDLGPDTHSLTLGSGTTNTILVLNGSFSGVPYSLIPLGGAFQPSTYYRLTPPLPDTRAAIWVQPMVSTSGFSLEVDVEIIKEGGSSSDGMAVVLQTVGTQALGAGGEGMGFGGISPSIAVAIDHYENSYDSTGNQIKIAVNGVYDGGVAVAVAISDPVNAGVSRVFVDYDGALLSVFLALGSTTKPSLPTATYSVNLSALLGGEAILGITAACGDLRTEHRVHRISYGGTVIFPSAIASPTESGYFTGGTVEITSGEGEGIVRDVIDHDGAELTLYEPLPYIPTPGTTVQAVRGCDKSYPTCLGRGQAENYRGEWHLAETAGVLYA